MLGGISMTFLRTEVALAKPRSLTTMFATALFNSTPLCRATSCCFQAYVIFPPFHSGNPEEPGGARLTDEAL